MTTYHTFSDWFLRVLNRPLKILTFCFLFLAGSLLWNGTLLKLYSLHKDRSRMQNNIVKIESDIVVLNKKITQSVNPEFIERQAIDRYDWVGENDLMFVFSER